MTTNKQGEKTRKLKVKNDGDVPQKPTEDFSRFTISSESNAQESDLSNEKTSFDVGPEEINNEGSFWSRNTGKIWMVGFTICLTFAGVVSFSLLMKVNQNNGQTQTPTPIPTQAPQIEPSPTPAVVDLNQYKISVLNGSGIAGEAAKVKSLLKKDDIQVATIGNAEKNDYEKSTIQLKKTVDPNAATQLKEKLSSYRFDKETSLDDSAESDIIIILGSSKTR